MKTQRFLTLGVLVSALSACSGGGGGGSSSSVKAPSSLAYGAPSAQYLLQVPIATNAPSFKGDVTSWAIDPALPAGLAFDTLDGSISGTPTALSALGTYEVTATGPLGSAQVDVHIGIESPPRFAFVAGAGDDTLATYTVDAFSGELRFHGFHPQAAGTAPEAVHVHPNGRFAYVPSLGTDTIAIYAIDAATGRLSAAGSIGTGFGPHRFRFGPAAQFAYVTASASNAVHVYSVDAGTGALTPVGTAATETDPAAIAIDPLGRFAYVANRVSQSLSIYRVDPATGELSASVPAAGLGGGMPVEVAIDPAGEHVYVVVAGSEAVKPYSIDQISGELLEIAEQPTGEVPTSIAIHPTGAFVYVTNSTSNSVSVFEADSTSGELTARPDVATGSEPAFIGFDASGLYAYVVNRASHDVSLYTVNLKNGNLVAAGTIRTRNAPAGLAISRGAAPVSRHARHLYALNSESLDVTAFSIDDATGALAEVSFPTPAGTEPLDFSVDPAGRFAYVADGSGSLLAFRILAGIGILDPVGAPLFVGGTPQTLAVDPSGRTLFVGVAGTEQVLAFAIDQVTGELTQTDSTPGTPNPTAMTVDPTGQFLLVSNFDERTISSFRVRAGQFLSGPVTATAPGAPLEVRFMPHGQRVYAALSSSDILVPYDVDPATGELSPVPPGKATGDQPTAIEIHPNGRFAYAAISDPTGTGYVAQHPIHPDNGRLLTETQVLAGLNPRDLRIDPTGRFLYVANQEGDDLSIFSIDPDTGDLTANGQSTVGLEPRVLEFVTALQ